MPEAAVGPGAASVRRLTAPSFARIERSRRRRRPSGEPPPLPRQLNTSGKYWLAASLAVLVLSIAGLLSSVNAGARLSILDSHILTWFAGWRSPALTTLMRGVGWLASPVFLQIVWLGNLVVLVVTRRWRHLVVWLGATLVALNIVENIADVVARPHPLGIEILGAWNGFAMPSKPMTALSAVLVNSLYSLVPQGRLRQVGKWVATGVIVLVGLSRLYLAQDNPSDVLVAVMIGVTCSLVAFRWLVPNEVFPVTYTRRRTAHLDVTGRRGEAIRHALEDQLGVIPVHIEPFGLEGSGGSTPLRVKVKGEQESYLFCKLYAANHVRSDRWYKLGRALLYGGLEDEKAFNSVRRLVQYEDYALRLLFAAGLPVPTPGGIVEITPEREYLLVMEFFDGAREIGDVDVSEAVIDQGLHLVRRLWEAGLAHRDIKPANVLVRDGQLLLIDSAFTEVRPSPWRQAVDLANMMLVLALSSDVERVYERARRIFSIEEITEAFAATRGLTMPTQLRRLMREQGRDLHAEFKRLLPYEVRRIAIQRWSWRRVVTLIAVLIVGVLTVLSTVSLLKSPLS